MASTTPNIGLTLPTGAEKVSRQIINENNTKIDTAIGGTAGRELLGYKENGDTASQAISDGSFVVWKGSLYKANGNISQGATLSALNLTAVPSGGFNDLQGQVDSLSDRMPTLLWTNSSPTTPRGEGTIATGIDFKGFTAFAVKVKAHVSVDRYVSCIVPLASETEMMFVTDTTTANRNVYYRYITINNGNIYITGATGGDGTTYQDRLIPAEVYGIL